MEDEFEDEVTPKAADSEEEEDELDNGTLEDEDEDEEDESKLLDGAGMHVDEEEAEF